MKLIESLRKKLTEKKNELNKVGISTKDDYYLNENIYTFETAYKKVVENVFKESYDNVTNSFDMYEEMIDGSCDETKIIEEIINHIDSRYLDEEIERTEVLGCKVEKGHTIEEYREKFGELYDEGELWDFSVEDFENGAVEPDPDKTYWLLEDEDGELRYFEVCEDCVECKESKELNEATSNFPIYFSMEYDLPLLIYFNYDEVLDKMDYEDDYPNEEDFEKEEDYWEAKEAFEEKYFNDFEYCILDEDEHERLEDKIYDFNSKSKELEYESDYSEPRLSLEPGYYEASYIDIDSDLDYLKENAPEVAEEQYQRLLKFLEEIKKEFGLTELELASGPASNGETGFRKVECYKLKEELSLEDKKENVRKAYSGGDMFDVYSQFELIDKNKTEEIAEKAVRESSYAKEMGLESLEDLWKGFEDGGNEDFDEVLLEVIHALDSAFETNIYDESLDEEKKKKNKKNEGPLISMVPDPEKSTELLNKELDVGDIVCEEKEEGVAREEYCLMVDGDNIDCYNDEEEAIKSARHYAKEMKERGLDRNVRVLLVKYGPKDEHGDEEELGCETIWAVKFDESLKEDNHDDKKDIVEYGIVYINHDDSDERGDIFETEDKAREFAKGIDKEKYNGYRIMKITSHEDNGERIYDDEICVGSEVFDESLKESSEPIKDIPQKEALKKALERFDENGKIAHLKPWKIARGGYDLAFQLYYNDLAVLDGINDGLGPTEIHLDQEVYNGYDARTLAEFVASVYPDCKIVDESLKESKKYSSDKVLTESKLEKTTFEDVFKAGDKKYSKYISKLEDVLGAEELYGGGILEIKNIICHMTYNIYDDGVDAEFEFQFDALVDGDFDEDEMKPHWIRFKLFNDGPAFNGYYTEYGPEVEPKDEVMMDVSCYKGNQAIIELLQEAGYEPTYNGVETLLLDNVDDTYETDEGLKEGKTSAQRYNDRMNKIFDGAKNLDIAQRDFLIKNGVAPEEAEKLYQDTGLHGSPLQQKLIDLGLKDEFFAKYDFKSGTLKENKEDKKEIFSNIIETLKSEKEYKITLDNGNKLYAKIIGQDKGNDLQYNFYILDKNGKELENGQVDFNAPEDEIYSAYEYVLNCGLDESLKEKYYDNDNILDALQELGFKSQDKCVYKYTGTGHFPEVVARLQDKFGKFKYVDEDKQIIEINCNESLCEEDEEEYLSDKITAVLDDAGILYGDVVEYEDAVNIVGVDEEEWEEVREAIEAELPGHEVLVPSEDHEEYDDEIIIKK